MKKILSVLAFFFCADIAAAYVGNPSEPVAIETGIFMADDSIMKIKMGYEGDFIFDARLKASGGVSGGIDECKIYTNQGVLTLEFLDRVEIYGSVGSMRATLSHRPRVDHKLREYQTREAPTWTTGGRVLLFQWHDTSLGMQGDYQWGNADLLWDTLNGTSLKTNGAMRYRQWQIAFGVSQQIDIFIPYAAVKYSNTHMVLSKLSKNLELDSSWFTMRNRGHFGLVLGCTLAAFKIIDLTGEVRLIDEEAISVTANIKF